MADLVTKYAKALSELLPTGKAWEAVRCSKLLDAMATEFSRVEEKINIFLKLELDPRLSTELLPDWEVTLGIPDECTPEDRTIEERREQVVQKLTSQGGLSAAYYEFIGTQLGFNLDVTNAPDFQVGRSRVGERLLNNQRLNSTKIRTGSGRVGEQLRLYGWRFYFIVNVPAAEFERFRVSTNRVGDPLVEFGNQLVECTIKKLKPAHVGVVFLFV